MLNFRRLFSFCISVFLFPESPGRLLSIGITDGDNGSDRAKEFEPAAGADGHLAVGTGEVVMGVLAQFQGQRFIGEVQPAMPGEFNAAVEFRVIPFQVCRALHPRTAEHPCDCFTNWPNLQ